MLTLGMNGHQITQLPSLPQAGVQHVIIDPLKIDAAVAHKSLVANDALLVQSSQSRQVVIDQATPVGVIDHRFRLDRLPFVAQLVRVN